MTEWSVVPSGKNGKLFRIVIIISSLNYHTGDDRPGMRDLHIHIVTQYAIHWERLGLELGLKKYDIDNISANNAHNPKRVEECCAAVLEQWLTVIPSPTWTKLDDAIKKITNLVSTDKGGTDIMC